MLSNISDNFVFKVTVTGVFLICGLAAFGLFVRAWFYLIRTATSRKDGIGPTQLVPLWFLFDSFLTDAGKMHRNKFVKSFLLCALFLAPFLIIWVWFFNAGK
jgi:hypothetical protein